MAGTLSRHAERLRRAGRRGDTELVHLAPEELALLRSAWGEPTTNPETGLPEHFSWANLLRYVAPAAIAAFAPSVGSAVGSFLGIEDDVYGPIVGNALVGGGIGALTGRPGSRVSDALMGGGVGALTAAASPVLQNALAGTSVGESLGLSPRASILDRLSGTTDPSVDPGPAEQLRRDRAPAPVGRSGLGWPLALGAGALALGAFPDEASEPQALPVHPPEQPMPEVKFDRRRAEPETAAPYYTFGTVPFSFFEDNYLREEGEEEGPGLARGRYVPADLAPGGDGRSDDIPARLSENEYVMDAETVALLGDGSPDAGARKLDELRRRVRRHKGAALARGKFSPAARDPGVYMRGRR